MVFAEAMLSTAADIAQRAKRSQGPAGWCASDETKAEMLAACVAREGGRERAVARGSKQHQPQGTSETIWETPTPFGTVQDCNLVWGTTCVEFEWFLPQRGLQC